MLHKSHKLPALMLAGTMLLSFNSCGLMEMRDCYVETEEGEASTDLMLAPAERVTHAIERPEEEETAAEEPQVSQWKVVLTGDVRIDSSILKNASDRAYEGQSYSFLTMYTGIYGMINGADAAMMSYSTAGGLSDSREQVPPIESLAALSDLGVDVLDTTGSSGAPEEHGMQNINASDSSVEILERDGVTFGFAALNGDESVPSETVLDQVEYAADVSDFTIVSVSWSEDADAERMKNTVRTLANAGADVIVGHSSGLGSAEWIDRADGNRTLAVYSLGNILSTSDNTADLIGGMLTFTVTSGADGFKIESPVLEPTFTHYTTEYRDYQVFRMAEYSDELAANHAIAGTCNDAVRNIVCGTVPAEFLPAAFRS